MARMHTVRERRYQPFYDTMVSYRPLIIPIRQNISVDNDFFGDDGLGRIVRDALIARAHLPAYRPQPEAVSPVLPDVPPDVPPPLPEEEDLMPILHYDPRSRRVNAYDSVRTDQGHPSMRLFGNANIGNLPRTNLQVPGQIALDDHVVLDNWYARSDYLHGKMGMLEHVRVTLVVGDKPQRGWERSLAELLAAKPWRPPERDLPQLLAEGLLTEEELADARWRARHGAQRVAVPVRQNLSVQLEVFGRAHSLFGDAEFAATIWIHLEGATMRGPRIVDYRPPIEILRDAMRDQPDAMAEVARWDPTMRDQVREDLHDIDRERLRALQAAAAAERAGRAPSVGVLPDAWIED